MLLPVALLLSSVYASPTPQGPIQPPSPPNSYTLTAYKPGDATYDGLKVQAGSGFYLYQEKVAQYCPTGVTCPNGTDTVFNGSLHPDSEVPGGQDSYASAAGELLITTQHEHEIPPDAFWAYQGVKYNAPAQTGYSTCPTNNPLYYCDPPVGYLTWQLPGGTAGIYVCPSSTDPQKLTDIYVVTPGFKSDGCVELQGLGVHDYAGRGPNPPVWAYY